MTNVEVKQKAKLFYKELNSKEVNYFVIRTTLEKHGYTVIEFNHIYNDSDVQILIDTLELSNEILSSKGFTYADSNYRLVFVHEDLSESEKTIILAHEAGHIYLGHMLSAQIIGKDVQEEYEANEFTHYLLDYSKGQRSACKAGSVRKSILVTVIVLAVLLIGLSVFVLLNRSTSGPGDYYITATGAKYHKKECIFVKDKNNTHKMTEEEFESGDYEACHMCLPDGK